MPSAVDAQHAMGHAGEHLPGIVPGFLQGPAKQVIASDHEKKIDHPAAQCQDDTAHDHGMLEVRLPGGIVGGHGHSQVHGGAGMEMGL